MTRIVVKERDIQKQIKEYLTWQGWYVVKIHQSLGSMKGIADLVATRDGQTVWIEVKTLKGKQSVDQVKFQSEIEKRGGRYIVARGVEDVKDLS